MADKDINIHVRTPGIDQTKRSLDQTGQSVAGIGQAAQGAGSQIEQASGGFSRFFGLFSAAAMLAAGRRVVEFFDDIKRKSDEAVSGVENLRKSYEGLFEAMNQYSEQGRRVTAMEAERLLSETSTPAASGLPTIEQYARSFKGSMGGQDYQVGIRQALSYAARHGGAATPDLIQLMQGYGMNDSRQQSEFIRMITAASGQSGMSDQDVIGSLGKAAPAARAMGLSPQDTISMISTLASGEIGRNKTMMPAMTMEAMASPDLKALRKYGISGKNKTANEILSLVGQRAGGMAAQDKYTMLQAIYGDSAAKGVYKLMTGGVAAVEPVSIAADKAEERDYGGTIEARQARTDAEIRQIQQDISEKEAAEKNIRSIGQANQVRLSRKEPFHQGIMNNVFPAKAAEDEAARRLWVENLTPEQRAAFKRLFPVISKPGNAVGLMIPVLSSEDQAWRSMTPDQKLAGLKAPSPVINQNFNNNTYINQTPPDARMWTDPNDL